MIDGRKRRKGLQLPAGTAQTSEEPRRPLGRARVECRFRFVDEGLDEGVDETDVGSAVHTETLAAIPQLADVTRGAVEPHHLQRPALRHRNPHRQAVRVVRADGVRQHAEAFGGREKRHVLPGPCRIAGLESEQRRHRIDLAALGEMVVLRALFL